MSNRAGRDHSHGILSATLWCGCVVSIVSGIVVATYAHYLARQEQPAPTPQVGLTTYPKHPDLTESPAAKAAPTPPSPVADPYKKLNQDAEENLKAIKAIGAGSGNLPPPQSTPESP